MCVKSYIKDWKDGLQICIYKIKKIYKIKQLTVAETILMNSEMFGSFSMFFL